MPHHTNRNLAMKRLLALSVLTTVLLAACAGSGGGARPVPTAMPTTSATGAPSSSAARIEVRLTEMAIDPNPLRVPVGVPVTFVVRNDGVVEHEFFVGTKAEQDEHEREMASGDHGHGDTTATVAAGEVKELTMTFTAAGATMAGCHIPGHYPAGMWADIEISD
jgi:uncharacterized cupredoxin-like copper-binding protein